MKKPIFLVKAEERLTRAYISYDCDGIDRAIDHLQMMQTIADMKSLPKTDTKVRAHNQTIDREFPEISDRIKKCIHTGYYLVESQKGRLKTRQIGLAVSYLIEERGLI